MASSLPSPLAAAIGIVPAVLEGVLRLPGRAVQLPVVAISKSLNGVDALRKEYGDLVDRGEQLVARLRGEAVERAEDLEDRVEDAVARAPFAGTPEPTGEGLEDAADAVLRAPAGFAAATDEVAADVAPLAGRLGSTVGESADDTADAAARTARLAADTSTRTARFAADSTDRTASAAADTAGRTASAAAGVVSEAAHTAAGVAGAVADAFGSAAAGVDSATDAAADVVDTVGGAAADAVGTAGMAAADAAGTVAQASADVADTAAAATADVLTTTGDAAVSTAGTVADAADRAVETAVASPLETAEGTPADGPTAVPAAEAPKGVPTPKAVGPDSTRVDTAVTASVRETVEQAVAAAPAAQVGHDELPLPDYDHMTLGSLRGRLRALSVDQLVQIRAYEKSHADRLPVVTMLDNRIAKLATDASAAPSGPASTAPAPEQLAAAAGPVGAISPASTNAPKINPPSHGDPTNPSQPR